MHIDCLAHAHIASHLAADTLLIISLTFFIEAKYYVQYTHLSLQVKVNRSRVWNGNVPVC